MSNILLTKSKYLSGLQCLKYAWIRHNEPEKIPGPDLELRFRFDQGKTVGDIAKKIYPEGIDLSGLGFNINVEQAQELINRRQTIFEAGIMAKDLYARLDILSPVGANAWDIIEVKSTTKIKDEHIHDIAFQRYCLDKKGIQTRKLYLMHINGNFVKHAAIDPYNFMLIQDVTKDAEAVLSGIDSKTKEITHAVSGEKMPDTAIGEHCFEPYECPLKSLCWQHIPEKDSVFILNRGRSLAFKLIEKGVLSIEGLSHEEELSHKQLIQFQSHLDDEIHIQRDDIRDFLKQLCYPAYFLDFETIKPAVPIYDNSRPYEDIPFQYVLCILNDEDSEPEIESFLSESRKDPRKEILDRLSRTILSQGSIVAYFAEFEKRVLDMSTRAFPEYRAWFESIENNFLDLYEPFKNFYYYNPSQQGSNSLKSVLPAITGKDYSGLYIKNGAEASIKYYNVTLKEQFKNEEKIQVYKGLLEYCSLDTTGMIEIVKKLKCLST